MRLDDRKLDKGMALLMTLVLVLIIAGLVAVIQARSLGAQSILARLAQRHHDALARDAVFERARLLVADRLTSETGRLPLNGEAIELDQAGVTLSLSVQDSGGLINLWFSPTDVLALLPGAPADIGVRRDRLVSERQAGAAFQSTGQVLAALGFGEPERQAAAPLVTLDGMTGGVNGATAPVVLRELLLQHAPGVLQSGQARSVRIGIAPIR